MKDIAIIGMQCRVPGANDVESFWDNLLSQREVIQLLTTEELTSAGVPLCEINNSNYVKHAGFIDNIDCFDAAFFDFVPSEARLLDPQARILLELSWDVLEQSGCAGEMADSIIGVFACSSIPRYLLSNILKSDINTPQNQQEIILANTSDCLATRISYKLGLKGPSFTIQSGCSSALAAIHQARIALLTYQCDAAIVASAALQIPNKVGYMHSPGGFLSSDGRCKPFSEAADGTIFTSGAAVIMLKRIAEAVAKKNPIIATIRGTAINNDGKNKAGFTAPGVDGQIDVLIKAQRVANVSASDISFIEAHGTGTPIGDPIEIEALDKVFSLQTDRKQFCAIGSVKSNIGHTDVTAGLIGLIKTSLALKEKIIPATLYFDKSNPSIDFRKTAFFVNSTNLPWTMSDHPRLAGVSSFGFGGTNVHAILEEYIEEKSTVVEAAVSLEHAIILSAKDRSSLQNIAQDLKNYLINNAEQSLADVAYTLQKGRYFFKCRIGFITNTIDETIHQLNQYISTNVLSLSNAKNESLKNYLEKWISYEVNRWDEFISRGKIINLPTYSFQRKSYWIDANSEAKPSKPEGDLIREVDTKKWIYSVIWQQYFIAPPSDYQNNLLFFVEKNSAIEKIAKQLRQNKRKVVLIYKGDRYQEEEADSFIINPHSSADFDSFFNKGNQSCEFIIYAWGMGNNSSKNEFYTILLLIQSLINVDIKHCKKFYILTDGSCNVLGNDTLQPHNATLLALSHVIAQEYDHIKTLCIDVDINTNYFELIVNLLDSSLDMDYVACRGNRYWVQKFEYIKLYRETTTPIFKTTGTYIITGGLGNVGLVYARYLAQSFKANLILIGRSQFPPSNRWDEILKSEDKYLKAKIRKIKLLLDLGACVEIVQADVTDRTKMEAVLADKITCFKSVDGIIHAAGSKGELHYSQLAKIDPNYIDQIFSSKIIGIENLAFLCEQYNVPTCVIVSSISTILGGLGLSVYSASHHYMNCFASWQNQISKTKWLVLNWDAWNFFEEKIKDNMTEFTGFGSAITQLTLTEEEGLSVLSYWENNLIQNEYTISTADLIKRHANWVLKKFKEKKSVSNNFVKRPILSSSYIMPNNEQENKLCAVWSNLLGIDNIGIKDNFFELGGHSLLALRMINEINQLFSSEISIVDLFDCPTIEKLAHCLVKDNEKDLCALKITERARQQQIAFTKYHQINRKEAV